MTNFVFAFSAKRLGMALNCAVESAMSLSQAPSHQAVIESTEPDDSRPIKNDNDDNVPQSASNKDCKCGVDNEYN